MKTNFRLALTATMAMLFLFLFVALVPAQAQENPFEKELPKVILHTSKGPITLELYDDQAPLSVENFLQYARDGHYDGTIFHRVISNFMIQGGGFEPDMTRRETREPITNEADNGLTNARGTIAMARTTMPHSATAQFYINVTDNPSLDHRGTQSGATWGYAVFGRVTEGMEVVDAIRFVETATVSGMQDVPIDPVIIERVEIL